MGSIRASVMRFGIPLAAAPLLAGCFAIADFDRFHGPGGASPSSSGVNGYSAPIADGLVIALDGRVGSVLAVQLASDAGIVTHAIFEGFSPSEPLRVSAFIPRDETSYRIRVPGLGHMLVGLLPHDDAAYRLDLGRTTFESGPTPAISSTEASAKVRVRGLGTSSRRRVLEARVFDGPSSEARVVGLYRRTAGEDLDDVVLVIPGCVKPSAEYTVSLYVDANGNGVYDDPTSHAGDLGVVVRIPSTEEGLDTTFDLTNPGIGNSAVPSPFSL